MRLAVLVLALAALLAPPAWSAADGKWTSKPAGDTDATGGDDIVDSVSPDGRNRAASARSTTGDLTTDALKLWTCATAMVCVTPDITNNATHDKTAEVIQCPSGSTVPTAAGCKSRWFKNASAVATKLLDGNEETGTDCLFGVPGPVIFVKWTAIASGTTQADALCEQAK